MSNGPRTHAIAAAALALGMSWFPAFAEQLNSGTVTVGRAGPFSTTVLSGWSLEAGLASKATATVNAPDGSAVVEFTMQGMGTVRISNTLTSTTDVRSFDSFTFVCSASATRAGDFAYLVDVSRRRRWYPLVFHSTGAFQEPRYFVNSFSGQDPGFDLSSIVAVKFQQSSMQVGDVIRIGSVHFERGVLSHGDAPDAWIIDIGSGSLSSVSDSVASGSSIRASLAASVDGQADIALYPGLDGISWDWTSKRYVSFYYKDSYTVENHYFLIYDTNGNYREWIFQNASPASWIKVTADLRDVSYYQSGNVDLAHIIYFELGVFGGSPLAQYSFGVDEVEVY